MIKGEERLVPKASDEKSDFLCTLELSANSIVNPECVNAINKLRYAEMSASRAISSARVVNANSLRNDGPASVGNISARVPAPTPPKQYDPGAS